MDGVTQMCGRAFYIDHLSKQMDALLVACDALATQDEK